jgi:hypothetical protein
VGYAKIMLAAGLFVVGLLAGWSIRDWKADSDTLSAVLAGNKRAEQIHVTVDQAAQKMAQIEVSTPTVAVRSHDTIREIYRDVKVPVDCAAAPAAVGVLEGLRQRANAATTGQPQPILPDDKPRADPPAGPGAGTVGG